MHHQFEDIKLGVKSKILIVPHPKKIILSRLSARYFVSYFDTNKTENFINVRENTQASSFCFISTLRMLVELAKLRQTLLLCSFIIGRELTDRDGVTEYFICS